MYIQLDRKVRINSNIKNLLLGNVIVMVILIIDMLVLKSMSVFVLGLVLQSIVTIYLCNKDIVIVKYCMLSSIVGLLFINLVYFGYFLENGTPYFTANGNDDTYFEQLGYIYNGLKDINFIRFKYENPEGVIYQYSLYVAVISWLIDFGKLFDGFHTFMPRMINVYMIVVAISMLGDWIDKKLFIGNKAKRKFLLILALFPNLYYIASFTFRDTFCMFLVVIAVINIDLWNESKQPKKLFYALVCVFLLFFVREMVAYVTLLIIFAYTYRDDRSFIKRGLYILCGISLIVIILPYLIQVFNKALGLINTYSEYRGAETGGLGGIYNMPILPVGIFFRALVGFITPLPSMGLIAKEVNWIYVAVNIINGIGTLYLLTQIPYLIKGLLQVDKITFIYGVTYMIFLSSMTFRHINISYPFLFLIIARGSDKKCGVFERKIYIVFSAIIYCLFIGYTFLSEVIL